MTFLVNGEHYSLCKPYLSQHIWTWCSGGTLSEPNPEQLCDCGTIKYKDKDNYFKNIQDAATEDILNFEAQP